jgi:GH15 family glucan-1,4-alpha-glucosidase
MRDTFYTLNAVNSIGHFEEMEKYSDYIANITINDGKRFQPLYKISGSATIQEEEIDLEGYLGNKPVRVGNQAYTHIQNDVYGQVLVSLFPLFTDSRFRVKIRKNAIDTITDILKRIEETMNEPDAGLWEFRNLAQQHCYTFLFHWAGASAIRKMGQKTDNKELEEYASKLRDEAAAKIEECYDSDRGVYTQAVGSSNLDASTLQLITMGYVTGDRAKKHLEVMEEELKSNDGLFYRYKHADDFGEPESTFLICAFWYVEALACVGRLDDAISNFESLMKYSNDLGLFSEDVDAKTGSQWGNFPQAYSHVGLINAAYRISNKLDLPAFL